MAWSQEASGGLRGNVQDADFYVPVEGVQIQLEGTGQSAVTDSDGRFFINAVPPGEYTVLARKGGYISGRRTGVVVSLGSVREVALDLTAEVVELDEFLVSGEELVENDLAALESVNLTRPLASFASALGRDFIAKSGGGDIGSAVKRLAGTSVVDSRYVVIRGLSDRYNVVVLNGARLPSSDPDKRAVNIDLFPSNLVENVINSKTYTPDLPGETTGGYLNIVTRTIPDKPFVNFSIGTAYNTQATRNPNFHTYRGGGTGFLGTGQSRALPSFLAATDQNSLPLTPNSRNFNLGNLPPNVLATFDLRDSAARALANTTLGVSTKEVPEDFSFSLSGGLSVDDFIGGRLGLVGAVTYAKTYRLRTGERELVQVATPGPPPTYQLRRALDYTEGEEGLLAGALLAAGWEGPNDDTLSLTYFTNIAAEDVAQFAIGEDAEFTSDNPNDNLPAATPYIRETLAYTERRLSTLQLRGEHRFPEHNDVKIDWTAAYSWTYQNQPDIRSANYTHNIAAGRFSGLGSAFDGFPFERVWRRLDDTNFNGAVNFEIPFAKGEEGEDRAKLKFGTSLDRSDRRYRADNFAYNLAFPVRNPLEPPPGQVVTANDAEGLSFADQITQRDLVPSNPSSGGRFTDNTFLVRPNFPDAVEEYTGFQNIAAGYAMTTFTMGPKVEVIAGARAELTDIKVRGGGRPSSGNAAAFFQGLTDEQIRNPAVLSADLLPAIAINYELGEDVRMRSSLTRTIARPTFKEIAAVFTRDPATGIFFFGNPRLQRSDIWNFDLRTEWFPEPGDFVILSFFSKSISNPIEAQNLGSFATVINERAGLIYGMEFEISKQLKDWDPILSNVRIGFNYSKIFSQVELTARSLTDREAAGLPLIRPLQGQPDYTMNFNLIYDSKDWGFSAAAFLNITGPMLYQTGGIAGTNVGLDIFQETFTSLDISLSKEIADGWKLGFRVTNLLNQPIRRVFRDGRGVVGAFDTRLDGITYSLALSRSW